MYLDLPARPQQEDKDQRGPPRLPLTGHQAAWEPQSALEIKHASRHSFIQKYRASDMCRGTAVEINRGGGVVTFMGLM